MPTYFAITFRACGTVEENKFTELCVLVAMLSCNIARIHLSCIIGDMNENLSMPSSIYISFILLEFLPPFLNTVILKNAVP